MCHEILTEFKTCGHTVPFLETCQTYLITSRPCATLTDPEKEPAQDGYCFDCLQKQSDEEAVQRGEARADEPKLFYKSRTTYKNCGHSDVADTDIERGAGDPEFLEMEERGQCWDCAKIPQSELDQMRELAGLDIGGGKSEPLVMAGSSGGNKEARSYRPKVKNAFDDLEEEPAHAAGRPHSPEYDESSRKGKGRATSPDVDSSSCKGKSKAHYEDGRPPSPVAPMHGGLGRPRSTSPASSEYSESGSEHEGRGHRGPGPDGRVNLSDEGLDNDEYDNHCGRGFPHGRTPPPQWGSGARRHGSFNRHPVEPQYSSGDEEDMADPHAPPNWGRGGRMHPLDGEADGETRRGKGEGRRLAQVQRR